MSQICAVILDFDGVLAESNNEKNLAFEELFALYPEYREEMRSYHLANYSNPRMTKFRYYVEKLMKRPGDQEMVDRLAAQFSSYVVKRVVSCPAVPGSVEFLAEFSKRMPLYIASVTPQEELRAILAARGIDSYIVEAFGNPPFSKEEAIQTVLQRERMQPSEVAFVGDSMSDYRVAMAENLVFFGRDSGLPFDEVEIELFPDLFGIAKKLQSFR